jgi:tetratricopeptide (TPR) repeat protein
MAVYFLYKQVSTPPVSEEWRDFFLERNLHRVFDAISGRPGAVVNINVNGPYALVRPVRHAGKEGCGIVLSAAVRDLLQAGSKTICPYCQKPADSRESRFVSVTNLCPMPERMLTAHHVLSELYLQAANELHLVQHIGPTGTIFDIPDQVIRLLTRAVDLDPTNWNATLQLVTLLNLSAQYSPASKSRQLHKQTVEQLRRHACALSEGPSLLLTPSEFASRIQCYADVGLLPLLPVSVLEHPPLAGLEPIVATATARLLISFATQHPDRRLMQAYCELAKPYVGEALAAPDTALRACGLGLAALIYQMGDHADNSEKKCFEAVTLFLSLPPEDQQLGDRLSIELMFFMQAQLCLERFHFTPDPDLLTTATTCLPFLSERCKAEIIARIQLAEGNRLTAVKTCREAATFDRHSSDPYMFERMALTGLLFHAMAQSDARLKTAFLEAARKQFRLCEADSQNALLWKLIDARIGVELGEPSIAIDITAAQRTDIRENIEIEFWEIATLFPTDTRVALANQLVTLYPNSVPARMAGLRELLVAGDWDGFEKMLVEGLVHPDQYLSDRVTHLLAAITYGPTPATAGHHWLQEAEVFAKLPELRQRLPEMLEKALAQKPRFEWKVMQGALHYAQGEFRKAITAFQFCTLTLLNVGFISSTGFMLYNEALSYAHLGEWKQAQDVCERAIQEKPSPAVAALLVLIYRERLALYLEEEKKSSQLKRPSRVEQTNSFIKEATSFFSKIAMQHPALKVHYAYWLAISGQDDNAVSELNAYEKSTELSPQQKTFHIVLFSAAASAFERARKPAIPEGSLETPRRHGLERFQPGGVILKPTGDSLQLVVPCKTHTRRSPFLPSTLSLSEKDFIVSATTGAPATPPSQSPGTAGGNGTAGI